MKQVPVAIIGASGYTGAELVRLLIGHPHASIRVLAAKRSAGQAFGDVYGQFRGYGLPNVVDVDVAAIAAQCAFAFCALPHGESAPLVAALCEASVRVIDLSADFRLRSAEAWEQWYSSSDHRHHPAPELLAGAVYGLPELYGEAIASAGLVAAPGCYPTASLMPLVPLLRAGLISPHGIIIDAKSGVSGAGRSATLASHFVEVGESIRPYKVAGAHRHIAEIEQELTAAAGSEVRALFTPHLVPMNRGILACSYVTPTARVDVTQFRETLRSFYGTGFVDVLPPGILPDTAHVRGSNRIAIAVEHDNRTNRVVVMSAIDNLVKGVGTSR